MMNWKAFFFRARFVLAITIASVLQYSILDAGGTEKPAYALPGCVSGQCNGIAITVIPQVELISIVQSISRYQTTFGFLMVQDTSAYRADVLAAFMPYREHPAVKMFERLSLQPRMLNFNAPSFVMLYMDSSLQVRSEIAMDDFVVKRAGGIDSLNVLAGLLNDFAIQSSFNRFFTSHRSYYTTIVGNMVKELGSVNYIAELEHFYGYGQRSYTLCPVSLYTHVGYGELVTDTAGGTDIYTIMGQRERRDGISFFGDNAYLKYMIRHEFSHSFINPLTEKYWDAIKEYAANFTAIPEKAKHNVCGEWQECINEFVIRGIGVELATKENEQYGKKIYDREMSNGVYCMDALLRAINRYEVDRKSFPTLPSYYPNVLEIFKKPAEVKK
jgi:hypothetical protein